VPGRDQRTDLARDAHVVEEVLPQDEDARHRAPGY
jgi:hypothetical protein